jgi:acetoin utilization deacetylase AcuC-like enzyme
MQNTRKLHIAFDPIYAHPLPEGHRFPMLKYELIPQQLLYEGTVTEASFFTPQPCHDDIVLFTHTPDYVQKLKEQTLSASEQRRIGFPQSPQLTLREWIITQGTIDCCFHAMRDGVALNVAGGTHHAFADRGEGFCLLNDFAVAANFLLQQGVVSKILVIDLDVHQGNGTAKIFEGDDRVFTFSMHGKNNYPFIKEKSDLDVELPDGIGDEDYLQLLEKHLPTLLQTTRPQLVFYLSGVDVLETDKFGKLKVTIQGCKQRDAMVFRMLKKAGIPCVVSMGGGYSPQVKTIVEAHCNTFRLAKEIFELY